MQTLEIEPPTAVTERILIHENTQEIRRITSEIQERANMLNAIAKHGLSPDEIKQLAISKAAIDDYIVNEQLKINRELKKQYVAGAKNLQDAYELPENLKSLKYALLAWHSYQSPNGRHGDKFQFITFNNQGAEIDSQQLENYFRQRKLKVYLSGEKLVEFRKVEQLITLMKNFNVEWTHIAGAPSLSKLIIATGRGMSANYRYFMD